MNEGEHKKVLDKDKPRGPELYLISPLHVGGDFPRLLEEALKTVPIAAFQMRVKGVPREEAGHLAVPLQKICAAYDTAFLVNDDAQLAKQLGADGVHLGQEDGSVATARKLLGDMAQIGVTCHDSRHLALEAGEAGADYVAFGAFYPSETKQVQYRAGLDLLQWWSQMTVLPSVAIGGIHAGNVGPLVKAGADFVAVSGAIWSHSGGAKYAVEQLSKAIKNAL